MEKVVNEVKRIFTYSKNILLKLLSGITGQTTQVLEVIAVVTGVLISIGAILLVGISVVPLVLLYNACRSFNDKEIHFRSHLAV